MAGLLAIEDRGPHSTGAGWTRGKAQKVWYHKLVGPATRTAAKLELDSRARIHTAVGHTRFSTQGAHTYANAHPVVAENIVLVHNGVVFNDDELVALSGRERVGEVDSWAIAGVLASQRDLGADHAVELLELVDGDFAVAWIDSHEPDALHLARGNGRPMAFGFTAKGDLMMASTATHLGRWARIVGVRLDGVQAMDEGNYVQVVAGNIVDWRTFTTPGLERARKRREDTARKLAEQRPLWEATPGSPHPPRPRRVVERRGLRGITDRIANNPDNWWDESERLLGSAIGDRPTYQWDDNEPF